jgi:formylmethanofuran dehydrogenase subunit E
VSDDEIRAAMAFHGHKCPAMPLGLRAAKAALHALHVERAKDKELHVVAETGKGHAAGCFLDGIMFATGCTYGKSNIEKLYHDKMAFTLIDVRGKRAVRVRLRDDFLETMLRSPFVAERKRGVAPQDVPPEIADPLVEKVLAMPEASFLEIGPVVPRELERGSPCFDTDLCSRCGERVFVSKLTRTDAGPLCVPCRRTE